MCSFIVNRSNVQTASQNFRQFNAELGLDDAQFSLTPMKLWARTRGHPEICGRLSQMTRAMLSNDVVSWILTAQSADVNSGLLSSRDRRARADRRALAPRWRIRPWPATALRTAVVNVERPLNRDDETWEPVYEILLSVAYGSPMSVEG